MHLKMAVDELTTTAIKLNGGLVCGLQRPIKFYLKTNTFINENILIQKP